MNGIAIGFQQLLRIGIGVEDSELRVKGNYHLPGAFNQTRKGCLIQELRMWILVLRMGHGRGVLPGRPFRLPGERFKMGEILLKEMPSLTHYGEFVIRIYGYVGVRLPNVNYLM